MTDGPDLRKAKRPRPWKVRYRYAANGLERTCAYLSRANAEQAIANFTTGTVVRMWLETKTEVQIKGRP